MIYIDIYMKVGKIKHYIISHFSVIKEKHMRYHSTRSNDVTVTASQAVLKGLADDGGLFVPDSFPKLDKTFEELAKMDYKQTAYEVMKLFLDDYTEDELKYCIEHAYDDKFEVKDKVELKKAGGEYFLELYHGATIAFKDMALSILPYLMTTAAKKNGSKDELVILTATSGDTGKAALAGFSDVPGTSIIVFYPKDGVSPIQEKQMVTQKGKNTKVIGIRGNFDDAQNGVKAMFSDAALKAELKEHNMSFSSANSINIGRLIPQVVYYVYSYAELMRQGVIKAGDQINVTVPTGNFGNILAASYAKKTGVPIKTLLCASNDNKVLYDFFETGIYDRNREFILTESPSMDILISSNLERLIYEITGCDTKKCAAYMAQLKSEGRYEISADERKLLKDFAGGYADGKATASAIADLWNKDKYVIDTHTAVGAFVYNEYKIKTNDTIPTVIASTASPFKFAVSVKDAIDGTKTEQNGDFEASYKVAEELAEETGLKLPKAMLEIKTAPVLHTTVCDVCDMKNEVRKTLFGII